MTDIERPFFYFYRKYTFDLNNNEAMKSPLISTLKYALVADVRARVLASPYQNTIVRFLTKNAPRLFTSLFTFSVTTV